MADPRDVSDSGRNPPPPPPPPPPGRNDPADPYGSGFGQRSPYAPGQDPYASGRRSVESSGLRRQPSTLDHSAASGVRPMDASALRRPDGSGVRRPDGSGVRRPDAPVHGSQLGVSSPLAGYVDREGPTFIDRSERGPVNRDDPTWRSNQGLGSSQGVAPLGQLVSSGAPTPRVSTESLDRLADTLGAPRSSGLIGRTIDDFRIVRLIAQGGMGAVYEAVDDQLKRRVALKTLLGGSRAEKSEVDRFVREAHAVSQLAHPNLVGIYRAGARDGVLYIAMELVQGETLHQLIRRSGFLEPHHAAEIIAAAASGLSHAHEHGILHRDMKPANVIVTPKGEVKVTDFGVAKVAGGESLTQSGIALGTPSYMSPEQALGYNDRLDERSDVYGLGAVLYECLTGRPPFHQSTQLATMEAVISEEVPAIELVRPGLDPQLIAVCKRCLEKEPGKRYASCEQLERDLQAWLQGRTVSAQAPHALRTLARRARPLAPVIPAALVLLLFLGYLLPRRAALRLGEAADDAEALLLERTAALEAALAPSGDPAALDELSALDLAASTRAELLGEAPSAERAAAVERGLVRVDPARLQALRAPEAAARARGLSPDASDAATRAAWSRVAELDPLSEVGRKGRLLLAQAALERDPAAERELERLAQTSDALGQRARGLLLGRLVAHREFGRAARVCDDPHVRSFLEGVGGRWRSGLPATLCPFNQEQGAVGLLALGEDGSTWWGGLGGPLAFRWNLPQGSIGLGVGGTTGLLLYVQRGSTFVVPVTDGLSHWSGAGFAVANHEVVHADYDGQTLVLSSEQGVLEITLSSLARSVLSQSGSCPVARLHGAAGGRTVWLDGRQLYDGRGALDASPCDALAPAWLGGTTRGGLAWAREPNGDDPRTIHVLAPEGGLQRWDAPPRARELLAWTTVLDDRPLLVRHYRSEAGYRLEWIALDGLAAPSTALGLDLPAPAFERAPLTVDLDQDGQAEWQLPGEVWGARLPRPARQRLLPDSPLDRARIAACLELPLEDCGLALSPAARALLAAEAALAAGRGDPADAAAALDARRAWELAQPAERPALASGVAEALLASGDAVGAAAVAEVGEREAQTSTERARWEAVRVACAGLEDGPQLELSAASPELLATSPLVAYRGEGATLVLRSDGALNCGVSRPVAVGEGSSLVLEAELRLGGAGDADFQVGVFAASRLLYGLRWDPAPGRTQLELVAEDERYPLSRPTACERVRLRFVLLPDLRGGRRFNATLSDERGEPLLRVAGALPSGREAVDQLAAVASKGAGESGLFANTLELERVVLRGSRVSPGPVDSPLLWGHGAWVLGRQGEAQRRYAASAGTGAGFFATLADARGASSTAAAPSDAELRFFWHYALSLELSDALERDLIQRGSTQLERWWPAPARLGQAGQAQSSAFARLRRDLSDEAAWAPLLDVLRSEVLDESARRAGVVSLLRARVDLARARGVDPTPAARLALVEALVAYDPPLLQEAAAQLRQLEPAQQRTAFDTLARSLDQAVVSELHRLSR